MTAFRALIDGPSRAPHAVAVRGLARGLDALNARTAWSHNDHFHGWVLRRLPATRGPAVVVDVGCGEGALLARLRSHGVARVVGIDPDRAMAAVAARRFAHDDAVTVERCSFFDLARGDALVPATGATAVTMIASLHHCAHERGLEVSLAQARDLLAPGGRLLVVGLGRPSGPADYAVDAVSIVANPVMGAAKKIARRLTGAGGAAFAAPVAGLDTMPVRDPGESFADVVAAAAAALPGARVRRRLWFRYTLEWTRETPARTG